MQYRTRKTSPIRKLFAASLAAMLMTLVGACGQGATTLALTTSGTEVDLAGPEWLVVNYWAEWCGPCRHEIPELNELDEPLQPEKEVHEKNLSETGVQVAGKGVAGPDIDAVPVSVLGVNYDGLVDEKLIQVSERMGINFAVLTNDPRQRWGQPQPTVLPSTYLIAPGGEFMETLVGPQTRAGILSRIDTLSAAMRLSADAGES